MNLLNTILEYLGSSEFTEAILTGVAGNTTYDAIKPSIDNFKRRLMLKPADEVAISTELEDLLVQLVAHTNLNINQLREEVLHALSKRGMQLPNVTIQTGPVYLGEVHEYHIYNIVGETGQIPHPLASLTSQNDGDILSQEGKLFETRRVRKGTLKASFGSSDLLFSSKKLEIDEDYIPRSVINYSNERTDKPNLESLVDVVTANKFVILLAEAGMGKTTELQYLNNELIEKGWLTAYKKLKYVELHKTEKGHHLSTYADSVQEGLRAALVLDALDESNIQITKGFIETFAEDYSDIHIVVSCRSNVFIETTLDQFSPFRLTSLNSANIQDYVKNKLGGKANDFFEVFDVFEGDSLLKNPFFLNGIVQFYIANNFAAPKSQVDLFKFLVEKGLDRRLAEVDRSDTELRQKCIQALEKVAFVMESLGQNVISKSDFQKIIKTNDERKVLLKQSSLIEWRNKSWLFAHRNFQEYLAAKTLARITDFKTFKAVIGVGLEYEKISRTWTNTLTYFSQLIDPNSGFFQSFTDWLMQGNPDIVVSFEKGLFPKNLRIEFFKKQLQYHRDYRLDIGIYFGQKLVTLVDDVLILPILIDELSDDAPLIGKFNSIALMHELEAYKFMLYKDLLFPVLMRYIDEYSAHESSMVELCLDILFKAVQPVPLDAMDQIIRLFPNFQRVTARNIVVNYIRLHKLQSRYLRTLTAQFMKLQHSDFGYEITYPDEQHLIKECIEAMEDSAAILNFLKAYFKDFPEGLSFRIPRTPVPCLIQRASNFSLKERQEVIRIAGRMILHYLDRFIDDEQGRAKIMQFMQEPGMDAALVKFCLRHPKLNTPYYVGIAIKVNCIGLVLRNWKKAGRTKEELQSLVFMTTRTNPEVTSVLIRSIYRAFTYRIEPSTLPPSQSPKKARKSFNTGNLIDILIDKEKFMSAIASIYEISGQKFLSKEFLVHTHNEQSKSVWEQFHPELIHTLYFSEPIEISQFNKMINNFDWPTYATNRIFKITFQGSSYHLSTEQQEFIKRWCNGYEPQFDPARKEMPGGRFVADADFRFVYFVLALKLHDYIETTYIKMLGKNFENGIIFGPGEQKSLCQYFYEHRLIDLKKLKTIVFKQLNDLPLYDRELYNYLLFIKEHRIHEALPIIERIIWNNEDNWLNSVSIFLDLEGEVDFLVSVLESGHLDEKRQLQLLQQLIVFPSPKLERWLESQVTDWKQPGRDIIFAVALVLLGNKTGFSPIIQFVIDHQNFPDHELKLPKSYTNLDALPLILDLFQSAFFPVIPNNQRAIRHLCEVLLEQLASYENWKNYPTVKAAILQRIEQAKPSSSLTEETNGICSAMCYFLENLEESFAKHHRPNIESAIYLFNTIALNSDVD